MIVEIMVLLIGIIAVIFVAGKWNSSAKKGSMVNRYFRRYPRYFNFQKMTMGRIAGANGIEKRDTEYSSIRYKTGIMGYDVDENIPTWAIKEYQSPNIPENIVIVKPFLPHTRHITDQDDYLIQINRQDGMLKALTSAMNNIKQTLSTQGSNTIATDQMNRMASMIRELKNIQTEPLKKETTILETPAETKKTT